MKNSFYYYFASIFFSLIFARGIENNQSTYSAMDSRDNMSPTISVMNINNIAHWIMKDGAYTTAGSPNGQQGDYPIFTGGLIYADGMLWGAKVTDHQGTDEVRVGGSTYYHGLKAGRVITDANGYVLGSDDPVNNHVWRVRRDWDTVDLTVDAANYYGYTFVSDVSADEIATVREQYEYDWMNWPGAWGAPYEDVNNDGNYDPSIDIPGFPGADQTMWIIANDVPLIVNAAGDSLGYQSTAPNLYGADPIGIELQITMWGYAADADQPLGNMIFKKATMKYTGLPSTPVGARMDSVYFTQWSDPDLGTFTDDYVGCDVDLSLGYVYNGNILDGVFDGIHGMPVPAGGYDFLQGPPDTDDIDGDGDTDEYLGMTSFTYFGAGSSISDPDLASYAGSLQFYNLMEGFLPRPEYPVQIPWTDLSTGEPTKFALSGDPITGAGWIDGVQLPPGDRRMVMSSGPFTMNLGDKADIVVALLGSQGVDNLESVRKLKIDDEMAQLAYDTNYDLLNYSFTVSEPSDQNMSTVVLNVNVSDNISSVGAVIGNGAGISESTTLEMISAGNYSAEISLSESPQAYSISLNLNGGQDIELNRKITTWYPIEIASDQIIYDNLSNDGVLNIGDLAEVALTVNNNSEHEITNLLASVYHIEGPIDYYDEQYLNFGSIGPNTSASSSLSSDEFGHVLIKILETAEVGNTVTLYIRFFDSYGNIWEDSYDLNIEDNSQISDFSEMEHSQGYADGSFTYRVVRPDDITGDSYKISFSEYSPTAARSAGKLSDCSGSTVSGYGMSTDGGTIDLYINFNLNCPGGAWVDGINYTFPSNFSSNINSWEFTEGNICSYGSGSGQNCNNLEGTLDGDVLSFGNNDATGFGAFESSNTLVVNVDPWFSGDFEPIQIGYLIYDDGYDGTVINADGTFLIDQNWEYPIGTVLMNLENLSTNNLVLSTDDYPNEDGTNFEIIDGFKLFQGTTMYGSAKDVNQIIIAGAPCWDPANRPCPPQGAGINGESYFDIDSYYQMGWALTAQAVDTYGNGLTSFEFLGRDIQVRFTGEYDTDGFNYVDFTDDSGNMVRYYMCEQDQDGNCFGGSYAWISGARYYDIADHPDPGNPGNGSPFRIWIPFEVWDMEAEGGPMQIDIDIYDRLQDVTNLGNFSDDPGFMYSFNPYNRMYTHFIHRAYQIDGQYTDGPTGSYTDFLTWNVVWWDTQWDQGDVVTFEYLSPISTEDVYIFTPSSNTFRKSSANIPYTYELSQNYPNPFNPITNIKYSIPKNSIVSLTIYDILGRQIIQLIDKEISAGAHNIVWDGKNNTGEHVSTGVYYYKLETDKFIKTRKMVLLK